MAHLTRGARRPHRIERGQGGALLTCPLEDDPEHALRRLWTDVDRLAATEGARPYTHVVAFGGTLPLLAAPTYAAWLAVPLITLLRGNDFDTGMFSVRRRNVVLDAIRDSRLVCVVASQNVERIRALAPGTQVRWITNGIDLSTWAAAAERAGSGPADCGAPSTSPPTASPSGSSASSSARRARCSSSTPSPRRASPSAVHVVLVGDADDEPLAWRGSPHDGDDHVVATSRSSTATSCSATTPPATSSRCRPSTTACPNVALEAAALGIPLLASDAGGLADLVIDGDNGFTFPAGDLSGCRRALDRAATATVAQLDALGAADGGRACSPRSPPSARRRVPRGAGERVVLHVVVAALIVVYAQGGGLGHLTRVRAALHTLGRHDEVTVMTSSPHGGDRRVMGAMQLWSVPAELAPQRDELRAQPDRGVEQLAPTELIVDAFPFGLVGELDRDTVPAGVPVTHLARLLHWSTYAESVGPPDHPLTFARTHVLEALHPDHLAFLRAQCADVETLELTDPPDHDASGFDGAPAPDLWIADSGRPRWLVVHSGPEDELDELVAYASEHAHRCGSDPQIAVVGPPPRGRDLYPAGPLFAGADRIYTAAGFNVMRQLAGMRDRHHVLPFPRRYDDQFERARRARAER